MCACFAKYLLAPPQKGEAGKPAPLSVDQFRNTPGLFECSEGGFFLMKKPVECGSAQSNSETAVARLRSVRGLEFLLDRLGFAVGKRVGDDALDLSLILAGNLAHLGSELAHLPA